MPRSRRRKGAKQRVQQMKRHLIVGPETQPRRYYDPGKNPRPSTKLPPTSSQQQSQRHNYQRGS